MYNCTNSKLTQAKYIYLQSFKTFSICFCYISEKEERLFNAGNIQDFLKQTGKDQMLVMPGVALTVGGEGRSTFELFSLYVTMSQYGMKGKIICNVFISCGSKISLLCLNWVRVNTYCSSFLKHRSKSTFVYRARICLWNRSLKTGV